MTYTTTVRVDTTTQGLPTPGHPYMQFAVPHDSGATNITLSVSPHTPISGSGFRFYLNGASYPSEPNTTTLRYHDLAGFSTQTISATVGASDYLYFQCFTSDEGGAGAYVGDIDITFGETGGSLYCAYGTEQSGGGPLAVLVTLDLVTTIAGIVLAQPWVLIFLLPAVGLTIDVAYLCAGQPPAPPPFRDLSSWRPQDALAWVQGAIWNTWCQCIPAPPGDPAPVTPPNPIPISPGTGGVPPVVLPLTCDAVEICELINALSQQIGAIQQQLAALSPLVTLIQRQKVPFAYIKGQLHTGLSGSGQFAVQGILALAVEVTTLSPATGEEAGDPQGLFGVGWVALGTADGWRRSVPVRHNPMWIDAEGDDTLVGYSFEPLIVANVQEIVREH